MKKIVLLILLTAISLPAQVNRWQLNSDIQTKLPSGKQGGITAVDLRSIISEVVASSYNSIDDGVPVTASSSAIKQGTQIYCIGDSLTAMGMYTSALQALLSSINGGFHVVNRGISGDVTSGMIGRFAVDVSAPQDASYIIIYGGINDACSDATAASIEANLQTLYTTAHATGAKVIAVTLTPFKGNVQWTSARQSVVDSVNTWIRSSTPSGVDYKVDAWSVLVDPSNANQLLPAYDDTSHLHISAAGGTALASAIVSAVTFTPTSTQYAIGVTKPNLVINQDVSVGGNPQFGTLVASYGATIGRNLITNNITGDNLTLNGAQSHSVLTVGKGAGLDASLGLGGYSDSVGIQAYNNAASAYIKMYLAASSYQLDGGPVRFATYGAGTLTTDASGNITASSDARLKSIDGDFTRGIEDIRKIDPKLYHWRKDSGLDSNNQYAGLIAQNVQGAIPEAVSVDPKGFLSLADRPIVAALINASKELDARVARLERGRWIFAVMIAVLIGINLLRKPIGGRKE